MGPSMQFDMSVSAAWVALRHGTIFGGRHQADRLVGEIGKQEQTPQGIAGGPRFQPHPRLRRWDRR